jgi:DNA (cytosine-5)-methyltransferase 1
MAKRKITQLDLFSGIGGFHLGFERAGYEVKSYFSEIDKHAVAVYKHRFKNSTYVGSVTDVRGAELPRIDLITFGSPCQDFSLAGKRKGMQGERSSLVLEAIRLINECRPSVFIWENVKGTFSSNAGADFWAIIQAFTNIGGYRLEWQLLNTSWVLPQNRERVYLVGYSTTPGGDWRGVFPIGESYQSNSKLERSRKAVTKCLTARGQEGHAGMQLIQIKSATSKGYEVATEGDSINLSQPNSETRRGRVGKGKAQTLETSCNQAVVEPMVGAFRGRNPENPSDRTTGAPTEQRLEINKNGTTNTLTSVQKDNVVVEPKIIGYTRDAQGKVTDRHLKDEAGTIHSSSGGGGNTDQFVQDYRIRRLTPIECERLQGFPDNHTEYGNYDGEVKKMSNTQRYKQCGNAVTVDIVALVAEAVKPLFK